MRSFDEFGFEKKSNTTENNNTPLADDFITRRKKDTETAAPETKDVALSEKSESALPSTQTGPVMTVMSIKGSENRAVTKPTERKKNIFASDNVLEKKKKKMPIRTVVVLAAVFALAFLMINQYVLINEYSKGISSLEKSIQSIEADIEKCETELVIKNKDVEKNAKQNGMISDKDGQGEYIQIPVSDSIELYQPEKETQDSLASIVMSALGENILHAWNTLTGAE